MSSQQKIRVLIVEDDIATCRLLKWAFDECGEFETVGTAGDGQEGIEMACSLKPDVVVMDLMMPRLDGFEAAKEVSVRSPSTAIVIISAALNPKYMDLLRSFGVYEFLPKPYEVKELIASVYRAYQFKKARLMSPQSSHPLEAEEISLRVAELKERLELYTRDSAEGSLVDQLERLAAGIAHDLRSPLNISLSILDTIDLNQSRAIEESLKRIRRRILYFKWIVDTFLNTSFTEKIVIEEIRLSDVISESLEMLESKFPPSLHLSVRVPHELLVRSDSNLLRLAFMNIIDNALEAMPDGVALDISVQQSDSYAEIAVTNEGTSIPERDEGKLFSIGFTTKPSHCGLGLYVARRIMRQLLGDVAYARSDVGKTLTTFRIMVPTKPVSFFHANLEWLKKSSQDMEAQLERVRNQALSGTQKEWVSSEFQRITSVFANNLYNELNIIELTIKNLLPKVESDDLRQALSRIARNCAYSQLLTRNIAELGETALAERVSLSPIRVIEDVLDLLERKISPDHYRIEWQVDPTLGDIEADETALKQVFTNLIRNALDAMPDGGVIKFQLDREGQVAAISVCDSGVGITPENLIHLFKPGFTTKPGGYGLGLYSAKTIVERHGGTISVFSRPGKGTTFTIRLPIKARKEGRP